jgi:hypothetical protein
VKKITLGDIQQSFIDALDVTTQKICLESLLTWCENTIKSID